MKEIQSYWRHALILVCTGTLCTAIVLSINRGLHGEYGVGIHGQSILFLGLFPFLILFLRPFSQKKLSFCASFLVAVSLSTCVVLYYLSSNGLWCAQHPKITQEMCAKLIQFASFAATSNVTSWWLTLGDLLAVQRGRMMPLLWEHDIDVCITPEQFPVFERAIGARRDYFNPRAGRVGPGHWYIPIDMAKLGLRAREAEGVNVDVWTCPKLLNAGNITRVLYCHGLMNVPGSWEDRHMLLTKAYGDYSVVKYDHHSTMCRIWNG